MSNDEKLTREWVDALLAKAAAGELELVREKRLRGPLSWYENNADDDYVAVYPKTAEARSWLLASEKEVNRSGRVEPSDSFAGKYYLRNGAEAETKRKNTLLATDGFGVHRPYAMNPLPADMQASFAQIVPDESTGGHSRALVLAMPPAKQVDAIGWLRKEGFLAKTDGNILHYVAHINRITKTCVVAVPVPEALAASVAANPHQNLLSPPLEHTLSLDVLAMEAAAHIRLPEKEHALHVKEAKPASAEPPAPPPLPPLKSAKAELIAIGLEVQEQPQWNGGIQRRLFVPKGQTLKPYLITDSNNARRFANPLQLTSKEVPAEGGESYSISQAEYARLTEIVGTLHARRPLPLDTAPLKKLFGNRTYKSIRPLAPSPTLMGKKPDQGISISHAMFAHAKSSTSDSADKYVVYVAADHKVRLTDFLSALQLHGKETTLNSEKERPCLIRLELGEEAWGLLKAKAEQEAETGRTCYRQFDSGYSLQAFDNEARDIAGVHRISEKEIAPEPVKKSVRSKVKGADAIQFLATKLSERSTANDAEGVFKFSGDNLRVLEVQRIDTWDNPTRVDRVLVVRAKVNQLNGLVRALRNQTDDFSTDGSVRLIAGSKNDGASLGVLEIVLPETACEAIESHRAKPLARHAGVLPQTSYKQHIATYFEAQERAIAEDEAHRKAWEVLARTAFVPVRISAPNETKLLRIDHLVKQLVGFKAELQNPEAQLEAWRAQYGDALSAMRKISNDEVFEDHLLGALRDIRGVQNKLEQGILPKIEQRISTLIAERQMLVAQGTHLEYVVLNPSQELRRALDVLKQPLIRDVIETNSNALRIVPAQLTEWAKALNAHGNHADSRKAPIVELDELDSWIRDTQAEQEAETEARAARQVKTVPTAAKPGVVVSAIESRKTMPGPTSEHPRSSRLRRGHVLSAAMTNASKATRGFLAWEAPFVHDDNVPLQREIKPQPVLVLSAATHKELEAIVALHETLKEEGYLLDRPEFYGEILHTSKLRTPQLEASERDDSEHGKLEALHTRIDTIKARLPNLRYALAEGMNYSDEMASVKDALNAYEGHIGNVAQRDDAEWLKLLKEALNKPHAETVQRCERLINQRLTDMNFDLNQLSGERKKTHARKENMYVMSVRESGPLFFPVDTKDGRPAQGREAMQLDTWRRIAVDKKGVMALKLYIAPEKLEALEQLIDGKAGLASVLSDTQREPLLPDQIVDRAHMMQVTGLDVVRARTHGTQRTR